MNYLTSFNPIIDHNSRILILGSMPSELSLAEHMYYGNPRNQFWRIIAALLDLPFEEDYQQRILTALNHGIALWDVLAQCTRKGSLDSAIKNPVLNDFEYLLGTYPGIRLVGFNGGAGFNLYKRKIGFDNPHISYILLPSTSPANTISLEEKIEKWKIILQFI